MSEVMKVVVTKIGLAKIMEATIENPLKLTHFAVGDGNGTPIEPNEDMTSLVNEKYRDFISDVYYNENNLTIECVLRANAPITKGFKIFEYAVFDEAGDMIAISQTPEQYRPSNSEGVATEWVTSMVLQIQNTEEDVIIEIPETIFATVGALQRAVDRIEHLENTNTALMKSKVGIDDWFNTNQKHKGIKVLTLGIQTWGLREEGNILKISDYPEAFKNCGVVDRGDGTFQVPIWHPNSTAKHLTSDNARELGTNEADAIASHNITVDPFTVQQNPHGHGNDPHSHGGIKEGYNNGGSASWDGSWRGWNANRDVNSWSSGINIHQTTATNKQTTGVTGKYTGADETRMKNTAGQHYLLLKINI